MADLTEHEIKDRLKVSLGAAIKHAELLAILPLRGPTFEALRAELKLVEGCCRQMAAWRGDTRWLPLGMMMEEAHQRAVRWLRYHYPRPYFTKLAENLRALQRLLASVQDKATGRMGDILPDAPPPEIKTHGRSVAVPAAQ